MKTILEIQKLDMKIKALENEVEKCPASVNFANYKKFMHEGRVRFDKLEQQANQILKLYNQALNKLNKCKGESEILKKRNVSSISLENASALINDANSLLGDLSEENRRVEELVRKAEEINRLNNELSAKLQEAKARSVVYKSQIEKKRQEIVPQITQIQAEIKKLEPSVKDKENYAIYNEKKNNGIFPVFVSNAGEFCGGCSQDLSLSFMEKLKIKKMLTCEHCGKIIMYK